MMIMGYIRCQRVLQSLFPKENQPRETFLFDRSHPALRVGVQIWRPRRQRYPFDPGRVDDLLKGRAVFPISVMDEVLAGGQEAEPAKFEAERPPGGTGIQSLLWPETLCFSPQILG
jgi:hypothetical protein